MNLRRPPDPERASKEELTQQVALASGFQLLIVVAAGGTNIYAFAAQLGTAVGQLREHAVDVLPLDPYLAQAPGKGLDAETLDRWVLWPLTRSPLVRECDEPVAIVDLTSPHLLGRDVRAWQSFLGHVNRQRNALMREFQGTLIFVVEEPFVALLAGTAPDLWSIRSGLVHIARPHTGRTHSASERLGDLRLSQQIKLREHVFSTGGDAAILRAIEAELYLGTEWAPSLEEEEEEKSESPQDELELERSPSPPRSGLERQLAELSSRAFESVRLALRAPRGLVLGAQGDPSEQARLLLDWVTRRRKQELLRELLDEHRNMIAPRMVRGRALLIDGAGSSFTFDLQGMQDVLGEYGFDIEVLENAERGSLLSALRRLAEGVTSDESVVVYITSVGAAVRFDGAVWGIEDSTRAWSLRALAPLKKGEFAYVLDVELGHILERELVPRARSVTLILDSSIGWQVAGETGKDRALQALQAPQELAAVPTMFEAPDFSSERGGGLVVLSAAIGAEHAYSTATTRGNLAGLFTSRLIQQLQAARGRRVTWGRLMGELQRDLRTNRDRDMNMIAGLTGHRGQLVFGRDRVDIDREIPVDQAASGELLLRGGQLHGFDLGDRFELLDETGALVESLSIVELGSTRARLDVRWDARYSGRTCVLASRRARGAVRVLGPSPVAAALRRALEASPWLRVADTDESDPLAALSVDEAAIALESSFITRTARALDVREARGHSTRAVLPVVEDLEEIERARLLSRYCAQLPALPGWLEPRVEADGFSVSVGLRIDLAQQARLLLVTVINIGIDGRLQVLMSNQSRGFDTQMAISWPARVPRQQQSETLWFIASTEPFDLTLAGLSAPVTRGLRRAPPPQQSLGAELYAWRYDFEVQAPRLASE